MNKLKVLFPIPRFEGGGLEKVQLYIGQGLIDEGYEVEILSHTINNDLRKIIPSNIKVIKISNNKYLYFIRILRYVIRGNNIVITSANDVGCFLALFKNLFFKKSYLIWTQHLSIIGPLKLARNIKKIKLILELFFIRMLIKKTDAVIAVSQSVALEIQQHIAPSLKINVIYNPVISKNNEINASKSICWPWDDDGIPTLIFVGRIEPVKRLDLLVDAFLLCKSKMNIRLMIVGEGSEKEKYQKIVKNLGLENECKFIGFQPDPIPWIKKANVLVLCSDFEGFGLVLVEAMACGTQIVATDCPSGPAELLENGKYGRLVPTNNSIKLAEAIYSSLQSPIISSKELVENSKKFQIEISVQQYIKLINVLKKSRVD